MLTFVDNGAERVNNLCSYMYLFLDKLQTFFCLLGCKVNFCLFARLQGGALDGTAFQIPGQGAAV